MKNLDWLKNKNVLIVGASAGIGKYLAFKLILHYNCKVIAVSNNQKEMEGFNERLIEYQNNFEYHVFDATSEKAWANFVLNLRDNKTAVDVLINCVGEVTKFKRFEEYTQKDITKSISTNFYSALFSIRYILPFLKKSTEPAIINVSCISSSLAIKGTSIYSATKSALKSYTQVLSSELDDKFYVGLVLIGSLNKEYKEQDEEISNLIAKKGLPPRTASKIILDGICKKKKRIVVGTKTHIYDYLTRFFPNMSNNLIKKWLNRKNINLTDVKTR